MHPSSWHPPVEPSSREQTIIAHIKRAKLFVLTVANPVWLAAQYHFPATYSCRMPLSSVSSVQATHGPGPATIRLALIRTGCAVYGRSYVQEELFPFIRAATVRVRPPERVAISQQCLRVYKARHDQPLTAVGLVESLQNHTNCSAKSAVTERAIAPPPARWPPRRSEGWQKNRAG